MRWHGDRATRIVYATDNSIYQVEPERVGLPGDATEITAALRSNYDAAVRRPVVARGAGTGTNGQSLTDGLVLDLKRNMHRIVSVDVGERRAVVQPGVVTAALNDALAPHGLFWPPHTSTLNRATVGGMISTDAAGKGSLIHGRAHRHVERIVLLLDDGTEWVAEPLPVDEAERRAARNDRSGELWRALLDLELPEGDLGLPELARGFSGYGLDRVRRNGMIDPVSLVCGAEGTLGVIVEATLKLAPLPESTRLLVVAYPSFAAALDDAVELREVGPLAIECFDETTLSRGRSSPAWPSLGAVIGDHDGGVLLLEFDGADAGQRALAQASGLLDAAGRRTRWSVVVDAADQARIWKVRADAVGLLAKVAVGGPDRSARPTAFVEDCAVPVDQLADFIADFRRLLDAAGLTYGMFGHADVGCVHVRPALDLTDPQDRRLVGELTAQVEELVRRYGGIVWGEHGRGFRGRSAESVLPRRTHELMRAVKTAFDPNDLFNPGKLYRPLGNDQPLVAVTEAPMRGQFDERIEHGDRQRFGHAFACNGNGLCHHHAASEAMCPSYKATGDPALSPKGRVDLLRSWLGDQADGNADETLADDLAANLHQCLSCSACTGHCPVEVDIPELKSRFLDEYYRARRRPIAHRALSHFERLAVVAARVPRLARLGRLPVQRAFGLVDLPLPERTVTIPSAPIEGCDVVLLPDVFTAVLEPSTLESARRVLQALGLTVGTAPFVPSGKFDHVKGRRDRFGQAAARQREMVEKIIAAGAEPVVIEPAIALLHGHDYLAIDPQASAHPHGAVRSIAEVLLDHAERFDRIERASLGSPVGRVRLMSHCTEATTSRATAQAWVPLLQAVGYDVEAPTTGCCGMAGIFGHEIENQQMSRQLWNLSWSRLVEGEATGASDIEVVATGYSCRSQAKRLAGVSLRHPLHLLAERLEGDT